MRHPHPPVSLALPRARVAFLRLAAADDRVVMTFASIAAAKALEAELRGGIAGLKDLLKTE